MKESTNDIFVGIFVICLFIIFGILIYLALTYDDGKPSASEFCIQNDYSFTVMNSLSNGYCFKGSDSFLTNKRWFAWDGSSWKFEATS